MQTGTRFSEFRGCSLTADPVSHCPRVFYSVLSSGQSVCVFICFSVAGSVEMNLGQTL